MGFTVTLPLPPSTNNLFKTVGSRRPRTDEYDLWIAAAGWALKQAELTPVRERYAFLLALPMAMPGDISNRIKAPEDLLVKHGLTPDDSKADLVVAHRSAAVTGIACVITVVPIHQASVALAGVGGGPRLPPVHAREEAEAA